MENYEKETIAAIATALSDSGIGIVRISGSEALEIADRVYKGKETITGTESYDPLWIYC